MVVRVGTVGNDVLRGTKQKSNLSGGDGDDILYGNKGFDILDGGNGADSIDGARGNDTITGGTGNDTLLGGGGEDIISAGDDDDLVMAGSGKDSVDGGAGNDTLLGNAGSDTLNGGDGNDLLDGGRGNDLLSGGNGNDIYRFNMTGGKFGYGNDTVIDTVGTDTLDFSGIGSSVTVHLDTSMATSSHDSVDFTGATSIASIIGGTGNDSFIVAQGYGNITIDGGTGDNTIDGTLVTSNLTVDTHGGTYADGAHTVTFSNVDHFITGSGDDTITVTDISSPVTIDGGTGTDFVDMSSLGGSDNATVSFGVTGIAGAIVVSNVESVTTGAGADTFSFGDNFSAVTIDGGTGTNTIDFSHLTTDTVSVNFTAGTATSGGSTDVVTFTNINNATGGAANDTFIFGNSFGTHTVDGGGGTNTLNLSSVTTATAVDFSAGTATTAGGALTISNLQSVTGGTGADTYTVNAAVSGTTTITDTGGGDTYQGFATGGFGSVILNDSGGTDTADLSGYTKAQATAWQAVDLIGSDGLKDSLVVHLGAQDSITINNYFDNSTATLGSLVAGTGAIETFHFSDGDLTFADITYVAGAPTPVPAPAPTPSPSPSPAPSPAPSPSGSVINGTGASELLTGGSGDDTLNGAGGNDTLSGAGGDDTYLFTGSSFGNDSIVDVSGTANVMSLSTITADLSVDLGTSLLTSSAGNVDYSGATIHSIIGGSGINTYTMHDGFSDITLDGGTDMSQTLTLDASDNTHGLTVDMDAGTITDGMHTITFTDLNYLQTGSGNDAFVLSNLTNSVTLDAGTGSDSLDMSGLGASDAATVAVGVFSGFGSATYALNFDTITTGAGDDIFVLVDGYDNVTLDGGAGSNSLDFSNVAVDNLTANFVAGTVTDANSGNVAHFSNITDIATGSGDDTITFGEGFGVHGVDAGFGSNTLNLSAVTSNLTINLDTGSITTGSGDALTLQNIQNVAGGTIQNVVGGSGDDTYTINVASTVPTQFTDGGGINTYQGFGTGGFGSVIINDTLVTGGTIDLSSFTQAAGLAWTWNAIDTNSDGNLDALVIHMTGSDTITVQNYFNNDTGVVGSAIERTGTNEAFHFSDGTVHFSDITFT